MIRNVKYFIFVLLFSFLFSLNVDAGICDGKYKINNSDNTCKIDTAYHFRWGPSSNHNNDLGYSLYEIVNKPNEYGMCLDPGLSEPYRKDGARTPYDYIYARELNIDNSEDSILYKIYEKYVHSMGDNINGKLDYLKYSNLLYRFYIIDFGWDICTKYKCSEEAYLEKVDGDVKRSKLPTFETSVAAIRKEIEKDFKVWENPLSYKSDVQYDSSTQQYTFKITVNFTNSTSQFFRKNGEVPEFWQGDFDVGYGRAYFTYYPLQINGGAYDLGNAVSYTEIPSYGQVISANTIANPNTPLNFELVMSKEKYDSIKEQQGNVYVNLPYVTYNPMSSDNVYILKDHTCTDQQIANNTCDASLFSSHQRMVVFTKYEKQGSFIAGGEIKTNQNLCAQTENNFYFNNSLVSIEEYKNKCGCVGINSSVLTNTDKINYYNSNCVTSKDKEEQVIESTLSDCNNTNNSLTKKRSYNVNEYCSITCNETINLLDETLVPKNLSVKAGTYFDAPSPVVNAKKECNLEVKYNGWNSKYTDLIKDEVAKYNSYSKSYALENVSPDKETVSCGTNRSATRYTIRYQVYDNNLNSRSETISWGGCSSSDKPSHENVNYAQSALQTAISNIQNHFNSLKTCNNYLNSVGDDDSFYNFQSDLKFYYQQKYFDQVGYVWNNNKTDGEEDDSFFEVKSNKLASTGNYLNYKGDEKNYSYINQNGAKETQQVGKDEYNNYNIDRTITVTNTYIPKDKYVMPFTGLITSTTSSVYLDKVYDINIKTMPRIYSNYYEFTSVGEGNIIYNYFKSTNNDKLRRYCTYEVTNEVLDCVGDDCGNTDLNNCKTTESCVDDTKYSNTDLLTTFRIVDSKNIDPNGRLESEYEKNKTGFKNWRDIKGELVKEALESEDTFNPDNISYSFTLDSKIIELIKEYNKTTKYSDSDKLQCNSAGNECISSFITEANKDKPSIGGSSDWKKFATNISGGNNWNYVVYDSSTRKFKIETRSKTIESSGSKQALTAFQDMIKNLRENIDSDDVKNKNLNP